MFLVGGVFWSYASTAYLREAVSRNPIPYDRFDVVVLGDSITEGLGTTDGLDYVSLLRNTYPWAKIRNSGVRGDTTAEALLRLETDVLVYDPAVVIILLGGNDFIKRVPKETTFTNLELMIAKLQERGITPILFGVPGGVFTDAYEEHFVSLQKKTDVMFVPNVLDGTIGKIRYMKDPLHPNDAGHALIYERVLPTVGPIIEALY